ncbi:MAG: hypothetical protein EXX96DRAFT_373497 [Benjaminiella poitrasii]|nr:MAG: hypothetical protein EXX96DRAFT_373497 [Benjaminiella poitrasii]
MFLCLFVFLSKKKNSYPIILNCKMDRGFFYNQTHWTCYRRNYFQVAATLVISGHSDQSRYGLQLDLDKPMQHIEHFYIRLSACASSNINSTALTSMDNAVLENHNVIRPVALIQMTAKRDKGPQREPPMLAVTPSDSVYNSNEDICVTYDRLQFKVATANNGKRKASQQYFRLIFQLVAQLNDGSQHIVSECYSLPLVVRGRSPGHYSSPSGQQRSRENKKKRSTDNSGITKDELFIKEKPPCSLSQYNTFSPTDEPKETATNPQNNSDPGLPYSQQQPMLSSSLLNASFSNFHTRSQSANDSAFYSRQQHTTNMKYHYKPVMNHNDMFDNNYSNAGGRSSSKMWQLHQRAEYYPEQPTSPNGLDYSNSNTTMYHPWSNMDDRFVKQEEQAALSQSSSSR